MRRHISNYFTLILLVLGSTLMVWLPFILRSPTWYGLKIDNSSMQYIYRNFDGPLYIVVAKSFYNPQIIDKLGLEIPLSPNYFAAHLPFYPMLISLFAPLVGYLKSMVFVNFLTTIVVTLFLYYFLRRFGLTEKPLILATIFLFIPKFLVVRSIGAPESLFIFFILTSLYFFEKEKYWLAGLMGGLAAMTKTPGILLFPAYLLVIGEHYLKTRKLNWNYLGVILIPVGLLAVFSLYYVQYHDFFAYFHTGGVVPMPYPFSVFNFKARWVDTAWLEEIVFYFFFYGITVYSLWQSKYRSFFYFSLIFFIAILFVQHRDIPRYSLPLWPMALVAFNQFFTSKKFLVIFFLLLPAIYLYAWNFIIFNIMPVSNWKPFI